MNSESLLYNYQSVFINFSSVLQQNKLRAISKKSEYLQKIMTIFRQFVNKCQKQIDQIINSKIQKFHKNYQKVSLYFTQRQSVLSSQDKSLMIAQFLIKPFQRFPFSGNKNQKLFKQQYNLIQKASVLIQQTLIDSFNQDEIPTFQNQKFFKTLHNYGLGQQSLTKLRINPQNFKIQPIYDILPIQKNIKSVKIINKSIAMLIGDSRCLQFWDLERKLCIKKFYSQIMSQITCCLIFSLKTSYLILGYSQVQPKISCHSLFNFQLTSLNTSHTKSLTCLVQYKSFVISGSLSGSLCLHSFKDLKCHHQSPHISPIQSLIIKNRFLYVLLKCSTVCEYEIQQEQLSFSFRRTLAAGYINSIRFPQVTSNFMGVACHIYGLSQIQINRKFKIQELNIINIPEMISDFIILESKQTSQFFAICSFQNSTSIKIYSLLSQQMVYQFPSDYSGQVGVCNYLPKLQITYFKSKYIIALVVQSQFSQDKNVVKIFQLKL